jgi:hypothetical protein
MRYFTSLVALALPLLACECRRLSVCEMMQLPTLFVGEVIDGGVGSIREDPWFSNAKHVRFKVIENLRGLPSGMKTVDVNISPTAGMCAPVPYYPGKSYLVMPSTRGDRYYDEVCFSGRELKSAGEDLRLLREYLAGKMPTNVRGRIAVAREPSLVSFLLDMGETKALGGVTVSTTYNGKRYSTTSIADGSYALSLPAAGTYEVHADLSPYASKPVKVTVATRSCSVEDLGMTVDNTISGRVWDEKGQPVKSARVGLIDLDHPNSGSERHRWFYDAYAESSRPDLTFEFENVPLGRYLLVFNPDGPGARGLFDLARESTYYPLASKRADARAIEVSRGGVHLTGMDLSLGPPVKFRDVTIRVRFPDGAPMKTARILCTGLPQKEGEDPWILVTGQEKNGEIRFSVPTNRRLKFEVKDWYGRDLKTSYISTHEAGEDSISQDFVVRP